MNPKKVFFYFMIALLLVSIVLFAITGWWEMIALTIIAGIQNMVFTWVSRSRNSGDPYYHFPIAVLSNSIWAVCNYVILFPKMLKVFAEGGDPMIAVITLSVYTLATAIGSTIMMQVLLKTETGKRQVGAR